MDDVNQKCQTVSSFFIKRFCIQIMSLSKQDENDAGYMSYSKKLNKNKNSHEIKKKLLELTQEP